MCLTRAELEALSRAYQEEEEKKEQEKVERGTIEEVKRYEHLPSSLPHDIPSSIEVQPAARAS
jgi:hypothetical protein